MFTLVALIYAGSIAYLGGDWSLVCGTNSSTAPYVTVPPGEQCCLKPAQSSICLRHLTIWPSTTQGQRFDGENWKAAQLVDAVTLASYTANSWGAFVTAFVAPVLAPPELRTLLALAIVYQAPSYFILTGFSDIFYAVPEIEIGVKELDVPAEAVWARFARRQKMQALICELSLPDTPCRILTAPQILLAAALSTDGFTAIALFHTLILAALCGAEVLLLRVLWKYRGPGCMRTCTELLRGTISRYTYRLLDYSIFLMAQGVVGAIVGGFATLDLTDRPALSQAADWLAALALLIPSIVLLPARRRSLPEDGALGFTIALSVWIRAWTAAMTILLAFMSTQVVWGESTLTSSPYTVAYYGDEKPESIDIKSITAIQTSVIKTGQGAILTLSIATCLFNIAVHQQAQRISDRHGSTIRIAPRWPQIWLWTETWTQLLVLTGSIIIATGPDLEPEVLATGVVALEFLYMLQLVISLMPPAVQLPAWKDK